MELSERIKKVGEYFKEMQIVTVEGKQIIYVVVNFPKGWVIDEDIEEKFGVSVAPGTDAGDYYFCAEIEIGEGKVFDAIDYNIEKMKAAIERAQLLGAKTKELREIFEDETVSLDELRTLKFVYGALESKEEMIVPKKPGRKPKDTNSNDDTEKNNGKDNDKTEKA